MNDFKLDSRPNINSGFKAPDAYFESLADRVMLNNIPMKEVKVVPLYKRRPVWVTSAAAAFVLSFFLLQNNNKAMAQAMPDSKTAEKYVVQQSGRSSYDLSESLSDEDIRELQEASITVDDQAIEDYLSNADVHLYQ
ncbi:hypothetical protein R1T16_00880 [Flavobacterium sp. DG1-102-2]|uniref:hypothetical protein n=1 Tax=Flavobacterium sp. DG1-102-2 TaxID=3081663 RepID=UPI002949B710|nr:hypothetical protein [Flavobacterium sp. DG1-102-2]MDV6166959.1 hypothetical protein [Flavobacterium sp. DG1-102-2]